MSDFDSEMWVVDAIDDESKLRRWANPGQRETCRLPLDPVDPQLAGKARLGSWWREAGACLWGRELLDIIDGGGVVPWCARYANDLAGWCGWNGTHTASAHTPDEWLMESMINFGLADNIKGPGSAGKRSYGKLRRTPKDMKVSRIVANMRELNQHCGRPPSFELVSTEALVDVLSFWGEESWYVAWDYRHWYYQMRLPYFARKLFTFLSSLTTIEMKVWCMGFAWTPYVGQQKIAPVRDQTFLDYTLYLLLCYDRL